jgi:hypothetical protein
MNKGMNAYTCHGAPATLRIENNTPKHAVMIIIVPMPKRRGTCAERVRTGSQSGA